MAATAGTSFSLLHRHADGYMTFPASQGFVLLPHTRPPGAPPFQPLSQVWAPRTLVLSYPFYEGINRYLRLPSFSLGSQSSAPSLCPQLLRLKTCPRRLRPTSQLWEPACIQPWCFSLPLLTCLPVCPDASFCIFIPRLPTNSHLYVWCSYSDGSAPSTPGLLLIICTHSKKSSEVPWEGRRAQWRQQEGVT